MSGYETTKHRDPWESFWLRLKPILPAVSARTIHQRPLPRFLTVADFIDGKRFSITIPTARRSWWFWSLLFLAIMWLMIAPLIFTWSINVPFYDNRGRYYSASFNYGTFLFGLAVLIGVTWLVWWRAFPRIKITADHQAVQVHNRIYPWSEIQGFRLGYSLGGVEREAKQGPYSGLRISHGPWGDDLPFLVRHYYAPAYVLFLNDALQSIQPRDTADAMAEAGIKPAMF